MVDISSCKNDTILYDYDILLNTYSPDRIIQLADKTCFEVVEFLQILIGNECRNQNPIPGNNNLIWNSQEEFDFIIDKIDNLVEIVKRTITADMEKLVVMRMVADNNRSYWFNPTSKNLYSYDSQKIYIGRLEDGSIIKPEHPYNLNGLEELPELRQQLQLILDKQQVTDELLAHWDLLTDIGECAIQLLSDYTEDFNKSYQALGILSEKISQYPKNELFYNLKDAYGKTLHSILSGIDSQCIHGGGYLLSSVYCTTINILKSHLTSKTPIHSGFVEIDNNRFLTAHFPQSKFNKQFIVMMYSPKESGGNLGGIVRIGYFDLIQLHLIRESFNNISSTNGFKLVSKLKEKGELNQPLTQLRDYFITRPDLGKLTSGVDAHFNSIGKPVGLQKPIIDVVKHPYQQYDFINIIWQGKQYEGLVLDDTLHQDKRLKVYIYNSVIQGPHEGVVSLMSVNDIKLRDRGLKLKNNTGVKTELDYGDLCIKYLEKENQGKYQPANKLEFNQYDFVEFTLDKEVYRGIIPDLEIIKIPENGKLVDSYLLFAFNLLNNKIAHSFKVAIPIKSIQLIDRGLVLDNPKVMKGPANQQYNDLCIRYNKLQKPQTDLKKYDLVEIKSTKPHYAIIIDDVDNQNIKVWKWLGTNSKEGEIHYFHESLLTKLTSLNQHLPQPPTNFYKLLNKLLSLIYPKLNISTGDFVKISSGNSFGLFKENLAIVVIEELFDIEKKQFQVRVIGNKTTNDSFSIEMVSSKDLVIIEKSHPQLAIQLKGGPAVLYQNTYDTYLKKHFPKKKTRKHKKNKQQKEVDQLLVNDLSKQLQQTKDLLEMVHYSMEVSNEMEDYIPKCNHYISLLEKDLKVLQTPQLLKEGDRGKIRDRFNSDIKPQTNILNVTFLDNPNNKCFNTILSIYKERNKQYQLDKNSICMGRTWTDGCGTPCRKKTIKGSKYCSIHQQPKMGKITRKKPFKLMDGTKIKWEQSSMEEEILTKGDILKPVFSHLPDISREQAIQQLNIEYQEQLIDKIVQLNLSRKDEPMDIEYQQKMKQLMDDIDRTKQQIKWSIMGNQQGKPQIYQLIEKYRNTLTQYIETDLAHLYQLNKNPPIAPPPKQLFKQFDFVEIIDGELKNYFVNNQVVITFIGEEEGLQQQISILGINNNNQQYQLMVSDKTQFTLLRRGLIPKEHQTHQQLYDRYIKVLKNEDEPVEQQHIYQHFDFIEIISGSELGKLIQNKGVIVVKTNDTPNQYTILGSSSKSKEFNRSDYQVLTDVNENDIRFIRDGKKPKEMSLLAIYQVYDLYMNQSPKKKNITPKKKIIYPKKQVIPESNIKLYDLVEIISGEERGQLIDNLAIVVYPPKYVEPNIKILLMGKSTGKPMGKITNYQVNETQLRILNRGLLPMDNSLGELITLYDKYLTLLTKTKTLTPLSKSPKTDPKLVNIPEKEKNVIMVFHSTYDHNQAFDTDGDIGLFTVLQSFTHFSFQYHKINSLSSIISHINSLSNKQKIAHLIIMAHGTQDSISLSATNIISLSNGGIQQLAYALQPKLATNSSILLHSCLVGKGGTKGNNFANSLSSLLPNHIIFAAEQSINRNDLLVTVAEEDYLNGILNMNYEIDAIRKYKMYKFLTSTKKTGGSVSLDNKTLLTYKI